MHASSRTKLPEETHERSFLAQETTVSCVRFRPLFQPKHPTFIIMVMTGKCTRTHSPRSSSCPLFRTCCGHVLLKFDSFLSLVAYGALCGCELNVSKEPRGEKKPRFIESSLFPVTSESSLKFNVCTGTSKCGDSGPLHSSTCS
jgi:hypothetical protein